MDHKVVFSGTVSTRVDISFRLFGRKITLWSRPRETHPVSFLMYQEGDYKPVTYSVGPLALWATYLGATANAVRFEIKLEDLPLYTYDLVLGTAAIPIKFTWNGTVLEGTIQQV